MYSSNKRPVSVPEWATFHQIKPHHICQNGGRQAFSLAICHNPRCSLACRYQWASRQAKVLIDFLSTLPNDHFIYFGNLAVDDSLKKHEQEKVRSRFLKAFKKWATSNDSTAKFYATSEIGNNLSVHHHYCLISKVPVTHDAIKQMWTRACFDRKTTVDHDKPKEGIEAAARYMFKFLNEARDGQLFIRLLRKKKHAPQNALRITWGSQQFYPKPINKYFRDLTREWYRDKWISPRQYEEQLHRDYKKHAEERRTLRRAREAQTNKAERNDRRDCVSASRTATTATTQPKRDDLHLVAEKQSKNIIITPHRGQLSLRSRRSHHEESLGRSHLLPRATKVNWANSRARPPPTGSGQSVPSMSGKMMDGVAVWKPYRA